MNAHRSLTRGILAAGITTFLAATFTARAQTWDGGGTNDNFNTANNWNPNAVPANTGTADLIFSGNVRPTPVVNINFAVDSVTFDAAASAFNIGASGGSILTVGAGGIANNSVNTQTFSAPVTFSTSSSITAGALVDFTGAVNLGASAVTVNANANVDFNVVSGTGGLVKNGTGTLNLASSGTQDYDITVNNGIVDLDSTMTFSSSSTIAVNGGTLDLLATTLDGATLTRSVTASLTGSSLVARGGATVAITGAFTTTSSIVLNGSGTTFTSGEFDLNGFSTFAVENGADATIVGDFDIASDGTSGTLQVTGAGSTFSVAASQSPTFGSTGAATVTFSNGATGNFPSSTLQIAGSSGSSATVLISGGAQVTAGTFEVSSLTASGAATVTVTGVGSKLISTFNIAEFTIGSRAGTASAVVNVENGGELALGGPLLIENNGTLNLNGGIITLNAVSVDASFINNGTLNFNSGRINFDENFGIAGAGNNLLGSNVVLGPGREITVPSNRTTTVGAGGALVLDGGLFQTGTLVNSGGTIDLRRGTLRITGSTGFTIGTSGPLGGNVTLPTGATLNLNDTTVASDATLTVDGGTFTVSSLTNNGSVLIDRGAATFSFVTNNAGAQLVVAGSLNNSNTFTNAVGARLELVNGTGRILGAGTLTNNGLIAGSGTISKPVTNNAGAEIRADLGRTLFFTGTVAPNDGEINLQGGTIDITGPVTNNSGGFISGRGALHTGGLTNNGQMAFSGGNTDIRGDVTLNAGSRVVTSGGGSVTTFFDDVIHNGTAIFTGVGASTVFFGDQSGGGPFTGTGTVYYIGDLRPGNSPGIVSYGGDLVFGSAASLTLEIGGVVAGAGHDVVEVAGTLFADGILILSLFDGYMPEIGDTFELLKFGKFAGGFAAIETPALPNGYSWDARGLATNGSVTVVPEPAGATLLLAGTLLLGMRRRTSGQRRSAQRRFGRGMACVATSLELNRSRQ